MIIGALGAGLRIVEQRRGSPEHFCPLEQGSPLVQLETYLKGKMAT